MSWRERIVSVTGRVAAWTGVAACLRERARSRVTILMYHKVLPDALAREYPLGNLVVRESLFREQVNWLSRHCRIKTVTGAMSDDRRTPTDRPIVCVTFDDGYLDNYAVAAPILEMSGVRGTFFVTTDLVNGQCLWFDQVQRYWVTSGRDVMACIRDMGINALFDQREPVGTVLGQLKRLDDRVMRSVVERLAGVLGPLPNSEVFDGMKIEHVRDLHHRGHEIAAHSITHPILTRVDDPELAREVAGSRQMLESWLDTRVAGFCYPNGDTDARVCAAVKQAGYTYACTTQRGSNTPEHDPLQLRRRMVTSQNSTTSSGRFSAHVFSAEVWGMHDLLRRCKPRRRETVA